jgi:hypothetical protein
MSLKGLGNIDHKPIATFSPNWNEDTPPRGTLLADFVRLRSFTAELPQERPTPHGANRASQPLSAGLNLILFKFYHPYPFTGNSAEKRRGLSLGLALKKGPNMPAIAILPFLGRRPPGDLEILAYGAGQSIEAGLGGMRNQVKGKDEGKQKEEVK